MKVQWRLTGHEPVVSFHGKGLYTLVMWDPDAPASKPDAWLHWLVINIPGGQVAKGRVITDYMSPAPPPGTGAHRYYVTLFKQPEQLDMWLSDRTHFNLAIFEDLYGLTKVGEAMTRVASPM